MKPRVAPWVRVTIVLVGVLILGILSYTLTGGVPPSDSREALVFQNALLLVILGSALLEHQFTKPADSAVNSLMGLVSLLPVYGQAPSGAWYLAAGYCLLVLVLSLTCVAVSSAPTVTGWRASVARFTFRPAVVFGRSRLLFSVVFLFGLWFFFSVQDRLTLALVVFWGLYLAIWPLRVPQLITAWFDRREIRNTAMGEIIRLDSPNILRVALAADGAWNSSVPKICVLPDGSARWVQPMYSQFHEGRLLATGLLTDLPAPSDGSPTNSVGDAGEGVAVPSYDAINESLGGGRDATLVGFVVEGSTIRAVRFETRAPDCCHDGMLVWCQAGGERVYYQVVAGETREESFASDKHGFQVATAAQIGTLCTGEGFEKYEWLPAMNTPVFSTSSAQGIDTSAVRPGDFELGSIPKSSIRVGGDFSSDYNSHTALLGVTGSGKTELAFDLIRHALAACIWVVCIDLTAQYQGRLADLNPVDLSIDAATAENLGKKLFDVETGKYGAGDEKKVLNDFAEQLRSDVSKSIEAFLTEGAESRLGLIRLEEISNTKATLWITELYMTCLLNFARDNHPDSPRILVVVEEAHTVMPETTTMGLGDFDSKGLVGKIAQIALQGRKYGVGLLVLAQRTATVSKTVLTQCNTIISFACYDDTSLGFLRNIFGPEHVSLIPNLPRLHAVAYGNWIRSERPVVFAVPFDQTKVNAVSRVASPPVAAVETALENDEDFEDIPF